MTDSGETRIETDFLGEMYVPADALYGAQTARAVANFPVSGREMPLGHVDSMSIAEAWTSMTALRRLHQLGNYQQNPICKHCIGA